MNARFFKIFISFYFGNENDMFSQNIGYTKYTMLIIKVKWRIYIIINI